jgi:hypothetical protein
VGCASYPTSKPHLSIDSFLGRWGYCEVRCEREKWRGGRIISALILTANTSSSSSSSSMILTLAPNLTPEKESSRKAIGPSPASRQHYEMNNRSGLHPRLCLRLLTVMSGCSDEFLLLLRHTSI